MGFPALEVLLDLLTGLRLIEEESVRQNTLLGISQYIQFGESRFSCDTQMQSCLVFFGITNISFTPRLECRVPVAQCGAGLGPRPAVCAHQSAQGSVLSPGPKRPPCPCVCSIWDFPGLSENHAFLYFQKCPSESWRAVYTSWGSDIAVLSRTGGVGLSGPRATLRRGWVCTLTPDSWGRVTPAAASALWSPGTGQDAEP